MIKFEKKTFKNGLRAIVAPMENTEAVTLLVLVGTGSRYETKNISGISHFLEHLFFKGTKSRPEAGQVHADLDKIGAIHNAFTSREMSGYWAKSSYKDFETILDIVSDILIEPLFKPEEIEKERGVILQEISMYEDEPRHKVWDNLQSLMYGEQPIGRDIAGTKENISKIRRENILRYQAANYLSKNMVVAAAGNLNPKNTFTKIEKYFEKISKGKNKSPVQVKISQKTLKIKLSQKEVDQSHFALAFGAFDMFDERKYALDLLSVILGGNFSSRLLKEIREKLGLAYDVFAFPEYALDCGYLGIGAGVAHEKMQTAIVKIGEILKDLKTNGASKEELESAKSFIRGQTALKLETSDEIAAFCANQEIFYKKILQPEEILRKIEKVSKNDIIKISKEIFRPEKCSLAAIGRHEDISAKSELYKKILGKI